MLLCRPLKCVASAARGVSKSGITSWLQRVLSMTPVKGTVAHMNTTRLSATAGGYCPAGVVRTSRSSHHRTVCRGSAEYDGSKGAEELPGGASIGDYSAIIPTEETAAGGNVGGNSDGGKPVMADMSKVTQALYLPDMASKLVPVCGKPRVYEIQAKGKTQRLYFDAGDAINQITAWLDDLEPDWRSAYGEVSLKPCFISGQIKSGKSMLLNTVIPAVMAAYNNNMFKDVTVMKLDLRDLLPREGFYRMCRQLLAMVVREARDLGIDTLALQDAGSDLQNSDYAVIIPDITHIFRTLKVPLLVLVDEVQQLLLPRNDDGTLDQVGMASARTLLKSLLCNRNTNCLWAVTGSGMAVFWAQLALAPEHGYSMLTHNYVVWLPATHDKGGMNAVLESLVAKQPERGPPEARTALLGWAANSALLCYAFEDIKPKSREGFYETLENFIPRKLATEVTRYMSVSITKQLSICIQGDFCYARTI
eukprot:GHUV01027197.1.p1 GENE.GHUV01027197.1~~GHUV01027197.1.p1  ORF type:complete len:478 (+),score=68.51 GHUV01027197.1:713-2146(+)